MKINKEKKTKELKKQANPKFRIKTLKRKLWETFSKYIRQRWADSNGMVMTCDGKFQHWKETHCGHLYTNTERNQSLGGNELWYYEHNFAPQSANGNYYDDDDSGKKYMSWAIEKYGHDEVKKMLRMKHTTKKFSENDLETLLEYYQRSIKELPTL